MAEFENAQHEVGAEENEVVYAVGILLEVELENEEADKEKMKKRISQTYDFYLKHYISKYIDINI